MEHIQPWRQLYKVDHSPSILIPQMEINVSPEKVIQGHDLKKLAETDPSITCKDYSQAL